MAGTASTKFRLSPGTLADLDALAASNGGVRSIALREAVAYWRQVVESAGRQNADELDAHDWERLGHLQDPDPFAGLGLDEDAALGRPAHGERIVSDWSVLLAQELVGFWEGKSTVLPLHRAEKLANHKLAKRIATWGPVRGYALMAALRYHWREPSAGIAACTAPEVWMTPTKRD